MVWHIEVWLTWCDLLVEVPTDLSESRCRKAVSHNTVWVHSQVPIILVAMKLLAMKQLTPTSCLLPKSSVHMKEKKFSHIRTNNRTPALQCHHIPDLLITTIGRSWTVCRKEPGSVPPEPFTGNLATQQQDENCNLQSLTQ